jgi:hypothetical protein
MKMRTVGHTVLMAGTIACLALTGIAGTAWAKQGKHGRSSDTGYCVPDHHPGRHLGHYKQEARKGCVVKPYAHQRQVHVSGGRFPRHVNAWEFEKRYLPCIREELEREFHGCDISGMQVGLDIRNGKVVGVRVFGYSNRHELEARVHEHFRRLNFPAQYSGMMELKLSYF